MYLAPYVLSPCSNNDDVYLIEVARTECYGRTSWRKVAERKSSRSRLESSFRAEAARNRRRNSSSMYGDRRRNRNPARGWLLPKGWQKAGGGWQVGWRRADGSRADCPLFLSAIRHPPSAACHPTTKGETAFAISPFVVKTAYFFFAAFFFPAFFLAFFLAAMV